MSTDTQKSFTDILLTKSKWVIGVASVIAIYGYIYKIPLVCYGCESPSGISSLFFKCIVDTSKDSELCKISNNIDDLPSQIIDTGQKITTAIVQELGSNLPETIKRAYENLKREIMKIIAYIVSNIYSLKDKIASFIQDAYIQVKNLVIKSKEEFYKFLIKPIMDFVSKFIINPIYDLVNKLIEFKNLIASGIENATLTMTGTVLKLRDDVIGAISSIPKYIEEFINALMDIVNFTTEETVNGLNKGVSEVVGNTNNAIKSVVGGVNTATGGITQASKDIAIKVQDGVNIVVSGINNEITGKINIAMDDAAKGLKKTLNDVLVNPANNITRGVSTAIGDVSRPFVDAINKSADIINDIKNANILGAKPLNFIPEAKRVAPVNIQIEQLKQIEFGPTPVIPGIPPAIFDLSYTIPKITGPDINNPDRYVYVKPDLIPKPVNINGGTPKGSGKNFLGVEKGGFLPQMNLDPAVKTITDNIRKPIDIASSEMKKIYNTAMDPIKKVITDLLAMAEALKNSIEVLFIKYLNSEYFIFILGEIQKGVRITYNQVLVAISDKIVKPMYNTLLKLKDMIISQMYTLLAVIKNIFGIVLRELEVLYTKMSVVLYETGKVLLKGTGYFTFYILSNIIDTVIPIKVTKSIKINFVLLVISLLVYFNIEFYVLRSWEYVSIIIASLLGLIAVSYTFVNNSPETENGSYIKEIIDSNDIQLEQLNENQPEYFTDSGYSDFKY